ncbi:hypothetical protein BS47DRAFT_281716 [Hydnum rufescens UP504]|uniref:Uncharacterized protein n=1 Tax=Hydnum rufescens UP504 TaxID=1448309 RepID=A0A9P6DQR0_9AGAM|nr:hypothetical protein BS47DRAFT_281716 [Hydnum rufescens UP504]
MTLESGVWDTGDHPDRKRRKTNADYAGQADETSTWSTEAIHGGTSQRGSLGWDGTGVTFHFRFFFRFEHREAVWGSGRATRQSRGKCFPKHDSELHSSPASTIYGVGQSLRSSSCDRSGRMRMRRGRL